MRMSIARPQAADDRGSQSWEERRSGFFGLALRRLTVALSVVLVLGAIGLLFSPAKAGANTVLAPTQVFASVGNSTVNVYSPNAAPAAPSFVQSLNDGSTIPPSSLVYPGYPGAPDNTAGSVFGPASPASSASPAGTDNFYVTDDYSGQISEYSTSGALVGVFASGLQNPLSLVFDNFGEPLRRSAEHALHRRVQLERPGPDAHRPRHHGGDGRRLDRLGLRPVHLLLHDRNERHLPLRDTAPTAPTASNRTSTRFPSPGPTPSRYGSSPTVARSSPTPTPSCASTTPGPSPRSTPAPRRTRRPSKRPTPLAVHRTRMPTRPRRRWKCRCRPWTGRVAAASSSAWPSTQRHLVLGGRLVLGQHPADRPGHGHRPHRGEHRRRLPLRPHRVQRLRGGGEPCGARATPTQLTVAPVTGNFSTPTPVSATLTTANGPLPPTSRSP